MFHNIQPSIIERMRSLEKTDAQDRIDGTPRLQRLRQIPSITGKFLALMAANAPSGDYLEKGGLLLADNAINHQESLKPMLGGALTDKRVDALIVPTGTYSVSTVRSHEHETIWRLR